MNHKSTIENDRVINLLNVFLLNHISLFVGFLKNKTCILVTHQLQYLSNVDHIILFEQVS